MAFTKAQILTFAGTLGLGLSNSTQLGTYFDDVVEEVGLHHAEPYFTAAAFVTVISGTATYSLPSGALRLLYTFMSDRLLSEESDATLEAYDGTWRATTGSEIYAFTQDYLENQFTLYPEPNFSSTVGGDNLDGSYDSGWIWTIYTEDRSSSIPDYDAPRLACRTLAKEFERSANQQDHAFADACREVVSLLDYMLRKPDES
jgi:hypothetical protein